MKFCVRCEGFVQPSEEFRVQNTKAMYQSERKATFWHTSCFYAQWKEDQEYRASVEAMFSGRPTQPVVGEWD